MVVGTVRAAWPAMGMETGKTRALRSARPCRCPHTSIVTRSAFLTPPACFDTACQQTKDLLYLGSLLVPFGVFAAVALLVVNRPSEASTKTIESNPKFGDVREYEVSEDDADDVARDSGGELCYRAVRYTPFLTEREEFDTVFRLEVGPVGRTTPRSYLFSPLNRASGQLYSITLEKPLGLIIEEDKKKGRARIVEIVPNSQAAQLASKAALDPSVRASAPEVGDVLRGLTTTVVTWGEGALIAQTPQREIVVFGCDNQKFSDVSVAMKRGLVSDGMVTLVLERDARPRDRDVAGGGGSAS